MISLASLTRPELIDPSLSGSDSATVLKALADHLAPHLDLGDADTLYRKLAEREALGSTGIGSGVAIPHCKVKKLSSAVLAVGVSRQGIDFGSVDGQPVRVFFLLVSPDNAPAEHLQVLSAISRWVKVDKHIQEILSCSDRDAIFALLGEQEP